MGAAIQPTMEEVVLRMTIWRRDRSRAYSPITTRETEARTGVVQLVPQMVLDTRFIAKQIEATRRSLEQPMTRFTEPRVTTMKVWFQTPHKDSSVTIDRHLKIDPIIMMLIWEIRTKNLNKTDICSKEHLRVKIWEVTMSHPWVEAMEPRTRIQMEASPRANWIHMPQPLSMIFFRARMNGKTFKTSSSWHSKLSVILSSHKAPPSATSKIKCDRR